MPPSLCEVRAPSLACSSVTGIRTWLQHKVAELKCDEVCICAVALQLQKQAMWISDAFGIREARSNGVQLSGRLEIHESLSMKSNGHSGMVSQWCTTRYFPVYMPRCTTMHASRESPTQYSHHMFHNLVEQNRLLDLHKAERAKFGVRSCCP